MVSVLLRSLTLLINIIEILIIVRILMSIFGFRTMNKFNLVVYQMTEPVLEPSRRLLSKLGLRTGMFDFSPLITIIILRALSNYLERISV